MIETWEPPFGIDKKHTNEFDEVDPYNPQNTVRGYINKRQGFHYGSLWVTQVNERECYQLIPSAPKQHYPFDTKGVWKWPEHEKVERWEKIDGTCIVGYTYQDADGNMFTSYKTRLRPFLGEGKFGNFKKLWDEMLVKYPKLNEVVTQEPHYVFVFELFGKRNHHLIRYNADLDTMFIFGRHAFEDYQVFPPNASYVEEGFPAPPPAWAPIHHEVTQEEYLQHQESMNDHMIEVEMPGVTDGEGQATYVGTLQGVEGSVWYFLDEHGYAVQIKCKPEKVLDYHWKPGEKQPRIPITSIYTTIVNAFENEDEPSHRFISDLLLEEYPEEMVHRARHVIGRTLGEVIFDKKLRYEVLEVYERMGVTLAEDKGAVMRHMAKAFGKENAGRIYRMLEDEG